MLIFVGNYPKMTSTTAAQLGPEIWKPLLDQILVSTKEGVSMAYQMLWDSLMWLLAEHWISIFIALFVVLTVAFIVALFGRWGSFGSLLYNYLYFGTLFVIGLIWGPEVFIGDLFSFLRALAICPICYFVVGVILRKLEFIK